MRLVRFALVVSLAAVACGTAMAADPPNHRAEGDLAITARQVLLKYCGECHASPDADKRRGRVLVSDYKNLVAGPGPLPFVSLDPKDASQVVQFLTDGSMPPAGKPRPTQTEVEAVVNWAASGATEFPNGFTDENVLRMIVADLPRVPEQKRPALRYISIAHLVDDLATDPNALVKADAALADALRTPTETDPFDTLLTPVPGSAGTLYRLDLHPLRWDDDTLFELTQAGVPRLESFRMVPFDLIQLEYPYAHTPPADLSKSVEAAVQEMNAHRKGPKAPLAQLRAVPFVRGDWLASALRRDGKPTDLARELNALAELAGKLGQARQFGTGPTVVAFKGGVLPKDATAPPVWAWYLPAVAPNKPPFIFRATSDAAGPLPGGKEFTITAGADRDVNLMLVEILPDDFVDWKKLVSKEDVPGRLKSGEQKPVSPNDSGKIAAPSLPKGGDVFYLLFASEKPLKPPVIVRSRHQQSAIWRVLPHEDDVAQSAPPPIVRQLVRITVAE